MDIITCKLSTILGSKRMSQRELARRASLSTKTVNNLYHDRWEKVGRETIRRLCETLATTPGELFKYIEEEENPALGPMEKLIKNTRGK